MGSENVVTNYLKAITGESGGMTSMIIMVLITIVNVILTSVKAYESGLDGSMSVASSALESFGDVFSCFVIGYYRYKEMTASPKKFPHGRSARAQAYNICAYIMISVAVGALLIDLDRIIIKEVKSILEMRDAIVMFVNVIVKCLLLLLCYSQRHHSELKILMMDQANDVFTNSVTIGAIFLAMYIHVIFDFLGAILICGWVVRNWLKVLSKNNKRVHGHIVRKEILENLKEVARNCSQVDHLFEMVAYYNGEPIVVEAYIRPVGDYHEAVEQLQSALLAIDEVQTVHVFPGNEKKYQKGRMSKITMESSKLERIIEEDETEDHHSVSQKSADEDCISDEGNLDDSMSSDDPADITPVVSPIEKLLPPV